MYHQAIFDVDAIAHRPITNSAYRGIVTAVSAFLALALLWPSQLSNLGAFATHSFAVLYISIFTLDANSLTLGNGTPHLFSPTGFCVHFDITRNLYHAGSCEDRTLDLIDGVANDTLTCQVIINC